MGKGQSHIAGIFAVAERFPAYVRVILEDLREIARALQFREALPIEQLGAGGGDKRGMRRSRHVRHFLQQLNILRKPSKLVIPDQCAKWHATQSTVPRIMDLLKGLTLVEFRRF